MSFNFILDCIFPKFCFGCRKSGTYLCSSCLQFLPLVKIPLCPLCEKPSPHGVSHPSCKNIFSLDGMLVLSDYDGLARTLIKKIKYKSVYELTRTITEVFISQYQTLPFCTDILTFVPLYPVREKERGFNQAKILAKCLAQFYKIEFSSEILIRIKNTAPQMSINDLNQRKKNIKNAFTVYSKKLIEGKSFVIVDDVATTGATLFEATKILKRNGATSVWAIVVARKIPYQYKS